MWSYIQYYFILYDVKNKNDFINFLTLFNKSNFLKNELI